jgi:hypothetical protein
LFPINSQYLLNVVADLFNVTAEMLLINSKTVAAAHVDATRLGWKIQDAHKSVKYIKEMIHFVTFRLSTPESDTSKGRKLHCGAPRLAGAFHRQSHDCTTTYLTTSQRGLKLAEAVMARLTRELSGHINREAIDWSA